MPTVGWIYEDTLERFLADTTQVPGPLGPPKPSFHCPFCVASFETPVALGEHLGDAHTGARPIFIYNGAEPKSQDTMRALARPRDLAFLNCTSVLLAVNGAPPKLYSVGEAATALRRSSGRVRVALENQFERGAAPIRQSYDLEFRVPSADELKLADRNFISSLAREDPRVADVDEFLQCAEYGGASEYANALADYVLGALLKDGDPASGVRPSTRDYRPKLNNALRVLQSFDRPLARLICAFIRFSSNGFPHAGVVTGYPELDRASALLNHLAAAGAQTKSPPLPESHAPSGGRLAVCPVDNGTTGVLRRATQAFEAVRWTSLDDDEFRAEAGLPALDPLDRVKLYVLWAYGAIRLGKPASALEPLRELIGDHCFGRWAEAALEEYDS